MTTAVGTGPGMCKGQRQGCGILRTASGWDGRQLCSAEGAQKEVRRLTCTEHQHPPVSDCAHCMGEEIETQRSEVSGLGLQSAWKKLSFKLRPGRL